GGQAECAAVPADRRHRRGGDRLPDPARPNPAGPDHRRGHGARRAGDVPRLSAGHRPARAGHADLRLPVLSASSALGNLGCPPVAVDPWETTLVWAYDLNWRPAPAFQGYVAYTAQLDALNAASIADAPADQEILRATGTNSIDGRNRLWDPPRYLLTELCRYR